MRFLLSRPLSTKEVFLSRRTILVDADLVAYQFAAACEKPVDWGDGIFTLHADAEEGVTKTKSQDKYQG